MGLINHNDMHASIFHVIGIIPPSALRHEKVISQGKQTSTVSVKQVWE